MGGVEGILFGDGVVGWLSMNRESLFEIHAWEALREIDLGVHICELYKQHDSLRHYACVAIASGPFYVMETKYCSVETSLSCVVAVQCAHSLLTVSSAHIYPADAENLLICACVFKRARGYFENGQQHPTGPYHSQACASWKSHYSVQVGGVMREMIPIPQARVQDYLVFGVTSEELECSGL